MCKANRTRCCVLISAIAIPLNPPRTTERSEGPAGGSSEHEVRSVLGSNEYRVDALLPFLP